MSSENKGKLPDQTVFHEIKIAGREKGIWNKIGVTYRHKDGKGCSVFLDYLPLRQDSDGKMTLTIRDYEPKDWDDKKPKQSSEDFG